MFHQLLDSQESETRKGRHYDGSERAVRLPWGFVRTNHSNQAHAPSGPGTAFLSPPAFTPLALA